MSTGREIVKDASELVDAVDKLMKDKATQKVVDAARKVKCGGVINSAVDTVDGPLGQVEFLFVKIRGLAAQLAGLSGLLGLMQPMLGGGQRLINTSNDQLQSIGLAGSGMDGIKDVVSLVTDNGDRILSGGQAVLDNYPNKADVDRLIKEFKELRVTIQGFKRDIDNG